MVCTVAEVVPVIATPIHSHDRMRAVHLIHGISVLIGSQRRTVHDTLCYRHRVLFHKLLE